MPELPEVEQAAAVVRHALRGRTVLTATASATRIFRGNDRRAFERGLRGKRFERVERRGKWLLIELEGITIASHFGMTGQWVRLEKGDAAPPHIRASLDLDDGTRLIYRDPRLFGRMAAGDRAALETTLGITDLGPDPHRDGVDAEALHRIFAKTSRPVRIVLLDQTVLAGVGNILATEALFFAKIDPARPAKSISAREARAIAKGMEKAVARGIARFDGRYLRDGEIDNPFVVYDRAGEPCPRCKTMLEKKNIGGRPSTACPRCQV